MSRKQANYVRGAYARAACSLIDHLTGRGIPATVGYNTRKRNRTLTAYVGEGRLDQVPKNWEGFTVLATTESPLPKESGR